MKSMKRRASSGAYIIVVVYQFMDYYCNFKQNDQNYQILRHRLLNCFKECHNISLIFIQGETNDVDTKRVKEQKSKTNLFLILFIKFCNSNSSLSRTKFVQRQMLDLKGILLIYCIINFNGPIQLLGFSFNDPWGFL